VFLSRGVPSAGDVISTAFGATWGVRLGRVDSDKPDPEGRLPKADASVAEITVSSQYALLVHIDELVRKWERLKSEEFLPSQI